MKLIFKLCFLLASITTTLAAHADFSQDLIARFPGAAGGKIERAFPGFWSVVKGNEVVFIRDDLSILINGDVVDLATSKSLTTQLRESNKPKLNVSELKLNDAIKFGSGSRRLFVFTDPDCPFCRQLEGELDKLKNVQIYIFPFPLVSIHPNARVISESIWCQRDRAAAWKNYLQKDKKPAFATCDNPISRNLALGEKYKILGTPALIFEDGTVVPGLIPADRIEAQLAASKKAQLAASKK